MKTAFYAALIATGLTVATLPCVAAGHEVAGGSKADECVSDVVTSVKFFNAHAGQSLIDITDVKRACEKKTGEKIKVFTGNKFAYDLD